ncbi:hypothetical protein [Rhodococcus artemisiae]|uniref:Uncharacterized protein n=1 Tax=Rhodococcus artemisiae TaxID=714159 RepID=A0ABU7L328_9NOCA|nr:hypothetical protein [Rhodococcus artemisiae]MEE2055952.1 hypothetical protein [Rhodococcus artemisiae]
MTDQNPIGKIGRLTLATRGADGPGQVELTIRGGRETYTAWSAQPLPTMSTVLVVADRGGRVLDVESWLDLNFDSETGKTQRGSS